MTTATLNDLHATSARTNVPAWGRWYAEASVDGEHELTGAVVLKIADLTLKGTVLSGGPKQGRSSFRIAGAPGWGKTLKKKSYANDAGVKLATILSDAALECGETMGPIDSSIRVGPAYVRPAGPASRVLQLLAPEAWYVDNDGVTQLGARPAGTLPTGVTRIQPVDLARGKVILASESIASILPGVVVDGLTAVDVLHEISAAGGLRSTVWGSTATGTGSALDSMRGIFEQLDPGRRFRGLTEYVVDGAEGKRLTLEPVRVSAGMPALKRVPVHPGVAGCDATIPEGMRVLVGFIDDDEARPAVLGFADVDDEGFQPTKLTLLAGGQSGGEHVATVEAVALLFYNVLQALTNASVTGPPGPWTGSSLQPFLLLAINAALAAQASPAPSTAVAQTAAAIPLATSMAAGTAPSTTSSPFGAAIAALATKTPNASGLFPSIGAAAVEAG